MNAKCCKRASAVDREQESYRELFEQVEQQERNEYQVSFGPTYKALHPYRADGPKIHAIVEKLMRSTWND